jgi:hypothetical protein
MRKFLLALPEEQSVLPKEQHEGKLFWFFRGDFFAGLIKNPPLS